MNDCRLNRVNMRREYTVVSEAYYAKAIGVPDGNIKEELVVGLYALNVDLDTPIPTFEFTIYWTELDGQSVPQIRLFDDSWIAFDEFSDVFEELESFYDASPEPARLRELLDSLGFIDATQRKDPNPPVKCCPTCGTELKKAE